MENIETIPLFSTPISITEVYVEDDVKNHLINLPFEKMDNRQALMSSDKKVLDHAVCSQLKNNMMEKINYYVENVHGIEISDDYNFYIKSSWVMRVGVGECNELHTHERSVFSGVLYLCVDDETGKLFFMRKQIPPIREWFKWNIKNYNIYNCDNYSILPKNNMLILFPSELSHATEKNISTITRFCIGFDVNIKGCLGRGGVSETYF